MAIRCCCRCITPLPITICSTIQLGGSGQLSEAVGLTFSPPIIQAAVEKGKTVPRCVGQMDQDERSAVLDRVEQHDCLRAGRATAIGATAFYLGLAAETEDTRMVHLPVACSIFR